VNKTPHENYRAILPNSAERALRYLENINDRRVFPAQEALAGLARLGGTVPEKPEDMAAIIQLLDEVGSPARRCVGSKRVFTRFVAGCCIS
jgi:hypothetical protein